MNLWRTLKGGWALTYPKIAYIGRAQSWGLSRERFNLVLSEDTTTPYSIFHIGPFEFFVRSRVIIF